MVIIVEQAETVILGYASFVYFISKSGYEAATSGSCWLMIYTKDGKDHYFQLAVDENRTECGNVYTNTSTIGKLFIKHPALAQELINHCRKPKKGHCHIDPSLLGMIETTIETGEIGKMEIVKCLHLGVSP